MAAVTIQAAYRGHLLRKQVRVSTVASGVIHTQIKGNQPLFAKMGMAIDAGRGDREVNVLSIDPRRYEGRAVGGGQSFNPVSSSDNNRRKMFGDGENNVFINGGFFNDGSHVNAKLYMPIGPTLTSRSEQFMPVPKDYRDQFETLEFRDQSCVSSAPILSNSGHASFQPDRLKEARFDYRKILSRGGNPKAGELYHANEPNPRAAISAPSPKELGLPRQSNKQNRFRLATAKALDRGPHSNGFTLPEWSNVMTHLSKQNIHPGIALNLDGGGSVAMGVTDRTGKLHLSISQNEQGRGSSTMLVFNQKIKKQPIEE